MIKEMVFMKSVKRGMENTPQKAFAYISQTVPRVRNITTVFRGTKVKVIIYLRVNVQFFILPSNLAILQQRGKQ